MDTSKLIFFFLVGIVCFLGTFVVKNKPRYFLSLMVFFAPFSSGFIFRHHNGLFLMDFPLLALIIYASLSNQRFRFYGKLPAIGLIIWGLVSTINAVYIDIVISELTRIIRAYLAFLCVINFTKTKRDISAVIQAMFLALLFFGTLGFMQWRWGYMGLTFLDESRFWWRAGATFAHPAMFGDYLILLIPIVFRLFIFYKPEKRIFTGIYGLLFLLSSISLLATYARGPWLSFAGAIMIMLLFSLFKRRFHPRIMSATAIMVLLATIFAIHYTPTIIMQFTSKYRQGAAGVRIPLNVIAGRMIRDNLAFGVGLGNYQYHSHKYITKDDINEETSYYDLLQSVHNSYMLVAAEAGVPQIIFLFLFIIFIFRTGWKVVQIRNSYISNLGIGILTGFVGLLVAFMAGPDYTQHQILMMFWVMAGFLVALSKIRLVPPKKLTRIAAKQQIAENKLVSI